MRLLLKDSKHKQITSVVPDFSARRFFHTGRILLPESSVIQLKRTEII